MSGPHHVDNHGGEHRLSTSNQKEGAVLTVEKGQFGATSGPLDRKVDEVVTPLRPRALSQAPRYS